MKKGNFTRPGPVPRFFGLEVIVLSLTAESESLDSKSWLFSKLKKSRELFPNLISRRQYNDRS